MAGRGMRSRDGQGLWQEPTGAPGDGAAGWFDAWIWSYQTAYRLAPGSREQ